MAVPPDNTTLAYKILADVNVTPRLERNDVDSAGSFTRDTGLEQHFHVKETFSADSDDVPVWELVDKIDLLLVSRFELRAVIHTNAAQFLADVPSNLPLCGGSERVSEVLLEILCKIKGQPREGWCDAECHFRRWALCATRPSCVPKRTGQSGSPCTWRAR